MAGIPGQNDLSIDTLDAEERKLMSADVELDTETKLKILTARRLMKSGDYASLVGVPPGSDTKSIRRAYHRGSKMFHPDRYYGKNLGPFAEIVDKVFRSLKQGTRVLADPRSRVDPKHEYSIKRQSERLLYAARLLVPELGISVASHDISLGGMFVISPEKMPPPGTILRLQMPLRNNRSIVLPGEVRWARPDSDHLSPPGFGLRFVDMPAESREALERALSAIRRVQPRVDKAAIFDTSVKPGANIASVIGIDLGTTNTVATVAIDNRVRIIPMGPGQFALPSAVWFRSSRRMTVGEQARQRYKVEPSHVVPSPKRLLGKNTDDHDIARIVALAGWNVSHAPNGQMIFNMHNEQITVVQVIAEILKQVKERAEHFCAKRITEAVLTIPVAFTEEQRRLLGLAGRMAGLNVRDMVPEPTSAALAHRSSSPFDGTLGVFDFGGGTFDFSVVESRAGGMRVLGATGDSWLGGDDFDNVLADAAANFWWRNTGIDYRHRQVEWARIISAVEDAKKTLSKTDRVNISIPDMVRTKRGMTPLSVAIARSTADAHWAPLVQRALATSMHSLVRAGIDKKSLSKIVLSGGTSHLPLIQQALEKNFEVPVVSDLPLEFVVALGAGVRAAEIHFGLGSTLKE